jgi:hypothetical protein
METPISASSKTEPHPSQQKLFRRGVKKLCQTSSPRMSGRTAPQFESTELLNLVPHAGTIEELKTSSFGQIQGNYPENLCSYFRPISACLERSVWEAPSTCYQVQGPNYWIANRFLNSWILTSKKITYLFFFLFVQALVCHTTLYSMLKTICCLHQFKNNHTVLCHSCVKQHHL